MSGGWRKGHWLRALGSAFLWLGQSDSELLLLGSASGFRGPFPTANCNNKNSQHLFCVKHCLGFESPEINPFTTHYSTGQCLTERQGNGQKKVEVLASYGAVTRGGNRREPRKADSAP